MIYILLIYSIRYIAILYLYGLIYGTDIGHTFLYGTVL